MYQPKVPFLAKVKDTVTGVEGTVTAFLVYMTNCRQYKAERQNKDGEPVSEWIDEERLEVVSLPDEKEAPQKEETTGGPSRGPE